MAVGDRLGAGGLEGVGASRVLALADPQAISRVAAERIVKIARLAVSERGVFHWALSGGSTPEPLYRLLATPEYDELIPWECLEVFWSDERCVSPEDRASNFGMVRRSGLLERRFGGVHRMPGEMPPAKGAAAYEVTLREVVPESTAREDSPVDNPCGVPVLDLVLLGLGSDGHTASLFPGSPALSEKDRLVVSAGPRGGYSRLTFTPPLLRAARSLLFLVSGKGKEQALRAALRGDVNIPAGLVDKQGRKTAWLVENALLG